MRSKQNTGTPKRLNASPSQRSGDTRSGPTQPGSSRCSSTNPERRSALIDGRLLQLGANDNPVAEPSGNHPAQQGFAAQGSNRWETGGILEGARIAAGKVPWSLAEQPERRARSPRRPFTPGSPAPSLGSRAVAVGYSTLWIEMPSGASVSRTPFCFDSRRITTPFLFFMTIEAPPPPNAPPA